jgi:hypothetical protein
MLNDTNIAKAILFNCLNVYIKFLSIPNQHRRVQVNMKSKLISCFHKIFLIQQIRLDFLRQVIHQ